MKTYGLLERRRTTQKERIDAQRTLAHFNIIRRMENSWDGDGNLILILPSILSIIPNRNINAMKTELEELKTSGAEIQKEPETESEMPL
jgi:hypothetical protein